MTSHKLSSLFQYQVMSTTLSYGRMSLTPSWTGLAHSHSAASSCSTRLSRKVSFCTVGWQTHLPCRGQHPEKVSYSPAPKFCRPLIEDHFAWSWIVHPELGLSLFIFANNSDYNSNVMSKSFNKMGSSLLPKKHEDIIGRNILHLALNVHILDRAIIRVH